MEAILFIYLVMEAITFLLREKTGLEKWCTSRGNIFWFKLYTCDFCFKFWIAVIVSIVWASKLELIYFCPFAVMGLWITINKILTYGR